MAWLGSLFRGLWAICLEQQTAKVACGNASAMQCMAGNRLSYTQLYHVNNENLNIFWKGNDQHFVCVRMSSNNNKPQYKFLIKSQVNAAALTCIHVVFQPSESDSTFCKILLYPDHTFKIIFCQWFDFFFAYFCTLIAQMQVRSGPLP